MRHLLLLVGLLPLAAASCVGDTPVTPTPGNDASTPDTSTDAVVTPDSASDSNVEAEAEAGPPPCGAPGETCCLTPLAPCGDGLTCSTGPKKCMVNDAWVVGEYGTFTNTIVQEIPSAHYDGATWTKQPDVALDVGVLTSYHAIDAYESPSAQVRAITSKQNVSQEWNFNGVVWQECKLGNSCVGPSGKELYSVISVTNSGSEEFWLSGLNLMYRCASGACTQAMTGLPGTFGQGTLAGTTAQDIWYSGLSSVYRYDGSKWTTTALADAYSIGQQATNDVWVANQQFRHWDGKNWTGPFLADGALTPGFVHSISGSGPKDIHACGSDNSGGSFIAHYDGVTWTKKTLPAGVANLRRVWAPSPIEAFAVGSKATLGHTAVILHWDGVAWTEMPSPNITYSGEASGQGGLAWYAVTGRARPRAQ